MREANSIVCLKVRNELFEACVISRCVGDAQRLITASNWHHVNAASTNDTLRSFFF